MDRISLIASEHASKPILIIDNEGSIGAALYIKLKEYVQVVLVSSAEPEEKENLLWLPFGKGIPQIPDEQYSHIFFIPETEKQIHDLATTLAKKAQQEHGKLVLVLHRKLTNDHMLTVLGELGKDVYMLILGDIFGGVVIKKLKSAIEVLFTLAKRKKEINLAGMGLVSLYPIEFFDAITEIIRVGFGKPAGRLFFLFTQNPITEMGVAHAMQKVDPLLKVDFRKKEKHVSTVSITHEGEYLLSDAYPTIEKLQNAYETFVLPSQEIGEESFWDEVKESSYQAPQKSFIIKQVLGIGTLFLFSLLLLPFITMAMGIGIGIEGLLLTKSAVVAGNVPQANNFTALAMQGFDLSLVAEQLALKEVGIFSPALLDTPHALITTGKSLTEHVNTVLLVTEQIKKKISVKQPSLDAVQQRVSDLKSAVLGIQKDLDNPIVPESIKWKVYAKLSQFSPIINMLDVFPSLIGSENKKTYLVLFQNNMELRPGGGFIGSYGLITVNKGKIEDFTIHDVYDADGLLKGHVEPPFPIRRFVQVHLYLRDSNFDLDFARNAYMAALLFHQETGNSIDGVIAVDLSFVKNVLGSVGSVYVPTYNETVTPDNFFLLTEAHAEKNFFPGSTQKKDFLRSFFTALLTKLDDTKHVSYEKLAVSFIDSVVQKHVQFAFNDAGAEDLVIANGFASSLWDARVKEKNTINDFLSVNEANIGFNKVNYFLTRNISDTIIIHDDGKITGTATITYTNTDKTNTWPGGVYKNYLRFFLPKDSVLDNIVIDGQEQHLVSAVTNPSLYEVSGFIPPKGLEIEKTDEGNTTYYGFLTQVLPGKTSTITASYTLSQRVDFSQPVFSYSQWIAKQPGTENYPVTFTYTLPSEFTVVDAKNLTQEKNTLRFSGEQTQDITFSFRAGKK